MQQVEQAQEIERKFLVTSPPEDIRSYPRADILQGYLAITENGDEIRLRQKGDRYYQTVKGSGDLVRSEREIELTPDQFRTLWPATAERRIEKTRYELEYEGSIIELDIYRDSLEGLCVAEVEFSSLRESEMFLPPAWCGQEVTRDSRYKNKNLARYGIPDRESSG